MFLCRDPVVVYLRSISRKCCRTDLCLWRREMRHNSCQEMHFTCFMVEHIIPKSTNTGMWQILNIEHSLMGHKCWSLGTFNRFVWYVNYKNFSLRDTIKISSSLFQHPINDFGYFVLGATSFKRNWQTQLDVLFDLI